MENEKILCIKNLDMSFKTRAGNIHAIRGIDIELHKGECIAIVGESGSGKSVTMKTVVGLLADNTIINQGSVEYTYTVRERRLIY